MIPFETTALISIGPLTVAALAALGGVLAWLISGASEELRRVAAREQALATEPEPLPRPAVTLRMAS